MGNNNGGDVATKLLPNLIYGCLNFSLVGLVKGTRGLIKQKDLGLFNKCAGNSKSLLLAT